MIQESTVRELIGKPFVSGARGPDAFDCYGLVNELYRLDGIDVPDYATPEGNAQIIATFIGGLTHWEKCDEEPGAMVVFNLPHAMHCAYVLDGGRMIHSWKWSNGVCIEPLTNWRHRALGYYRYVRK